MTNTNKTKRAILISVDLEKDIVRIILDDVLSQDILADFWKKEVHYTHKEYSENDFYNLEQNERELANFGYAILARLYAFKKRNEL